MIMICNKSSKVSKAELAQSVERTTLNRVVVGSIPTFGENSFYFFLLFLEPSHTGRYAEASTFDLYVEPMTSRIDC